MAAGAPLSSRMGVVASFLLVAPASGVAIGTCGKQRDCVEWTMTKSPVACEGKARTNGEGQTCPGMWQVCMKIHKKDATHAECPSLMVRSICPNDACPADTANPVAAVAPNNCGDPLLVSEEYCQYGEPGDVLKFFVRDSDTDCTSDNDDHVARPQWPFAAHTEACQATTSCRAAVAGDAFCKSGCDGEPGPTPCVHSFTIPTECACEDPVEPPVEPPAIESMPAGPANEADPLNALGIAAAPSATASASSSMLAMVSTACVALAAAAGVVVYRRLRAAPSAENARDMEPLEVGLAE